MSHAVLLQWAVLWGCVAAPAPPASDLRQAVPKRTLEIRDALSRVVKFAGYDDPKINLDEALGQLSDKYSLTFSVNENAFEADGVPNVLHTEIAAVNPIPPSIGTLDAVIKKILSRVRGTEAVVVLRGDCCEITTRAALRKEFYGGRADDFPLVIALFEDRTLEDALNELARVYGRTVVLDPGAASRARHVRAALMNVPLDAAVGLLAHMARLTVQRVGTALYVTTPDDVGRPRAELEDGSTPGHGAVAKRELSSAGSDDSARAARRERYRPDR